MFFEWLQCQWKVNREQVKSKTVNKFQLNRTILFASGDNTPPFLTSNTFGARIHDRSMPRLLENKCRKLYICASQTFMSLPQVNAAQVT